MTTDEALGVASQLVDIGCRRVILIGGEVFLREDWDAIAKRLAAGGVEVSIITNGSCFDNGIWSRLKDAGVNYIGASVDGTRVAHDAMRCPGSFDVAMRAIVELKTRGFTVAVVTVLTAENIGTISDLYDELESRGVDVWQLQLCSPFGNASHSSGAVPSEDRVADVISFIAAKASRFAGGEASMNVVAADNIGYFTSDEVSIRGGSRRCFSGCAAGLSVIGIDSVGNVRGCESLYDDCFIEGNLRERSLASIWADKDAFAYNRHFNASLLSGKCADCIYGHHCAAGCRSINYFHSGNMYESRTCIADMV